MESEAWQDENIGGDKAIIEDLLGNKRDNDNGFSNQNEWVPMEENNDGIVASMGSQTAPIMDDKNINKIIRELQMGQKDSQNGSLNLVKVRNQVVCWAR